MYDIPLAIFVVGLWLIGANVAGYYVTRLIVSGWPKKETPALEDTQSVRVIDNYATSPNANPTYIISPMPRKETHG